MPYATDFGDLGRYVDTALTGTTSDQQSLDSWLTSSQSAYTSQVDRDIASGSSSDTIRVDLEAVAVFYGQLAAIQRTLATQYGQLLVSVQAAATRTMRPSTPGLTALLDAAHQAAGALSEGKPDATALGNVFAVWKIIGGHQSAAYDCVQAYATQENIVVDSFNAIATTNDDNSLRLPVTQVVAR